MRRRHLIFLDCEYIPRRFPALLSLGMVSRGGLEHYVELHRASAATLASASGRDPSAVLKQWGLVPGSAADLRQMGRRTAQWLLAQASQSGGPVTVAFKHPMHFQLLERVIRDARLWKAVHPHLRKLSLRNLRRTFDGGLATAQAYEALQRRGLAPDHALAGAHALRCKYGAYLTGRMLWP